MHAKPLVVLLALGMLLPVLLLTMVPPNVAATEDLATETGRSTSWLKTTLNNSNEVSQSISAQVDGQGFVYVAYYSGSSSSLMYETNYNQRWTTYSVDGSNGAGYYNSIDEAGSRVAIAYYDSGKQDLKFAYGAKTGLSFTTGTLDSTGDVGKYCSLAIDSQGDLGISYYDATQEKLKYLGYDFQTGQASIEVVDDMNPGSTSVSFFTNGTPVITYMDRSPYHLKYAMKVDGVWKYGDVTSFAVGDVSSSSVDIYDSLHVAFINSTDGHLGYAKWSAGSWSYAYPDPATQVAQSLSVRPDLLGKAHISYYGSVQTDLMYATNRDGPWNCQALDSQGNQGSRNCLGVDNYTKVHVVYIDSEGNLNKITNSMASWDIRTISPELPGAGSNNSIAVDSDGYNHIAFNDQVNGTLYYFTDKDGVENITMVDSGGVGQNPSICLDQNGNVFISYYDQTNKNIKIAYNTTGNWTTKTVDNSDNVGMYSSIAVASNGKVYIVYSDDGAETLKFAVATPFGDKYSLTTNLVSEDIIAEPGLDMVMDGNGNLHLSFFQEGQLWYGVYNPSASVPAWAPSVVDNAFTCGVSTSITVSPSNLLYISYFINDTSEQGLRLAFGAPGAWTKQWVVQKESTGPGYSNSVSVDLNGIPHLAYTKKVAPSDLSTSDFYFGLWSSGIVDNSTVSGTVSSASDNMGRTHIAYYDSDSQTLCLATLVVTPGAATNLMALAGNGIVQLSWSAPEANGGDPVTSYVIFRGMSSNEMFPYKMVTGTSYDDTAIINGQTYYYVVKAVNSEGAGSSSNQISASPQGEETSDPIDLTLVMIIAIIAVVVVVAIVLLLRYRR